MFVKAIETVFIMIILIGIGWIISKRKWIDESGKSFLIKLIMYIAIPAVAITNFFELFPKSMIKESYKFILIPFIPMGVLYFSSLILSKFINLESNKKGGFIAMSTVSNSIFFGLPICIGLFGDHSVPYVIFYYIANTIMFWVACSPIIIRDGNIQGKSYLDNLKKIINPPLVSIIVCGVLFSINFTPPNLIMKLANYYSALVTPLACIVTGKIIYDINFKEYKFDKSIFIIIFMRFIFAPTLMFLIASWLSLPKIAIQVFTILAAMPVMMQTTIVSEMYGADSKYVATGLSVTTILSLFFIPLYMLII